MKFLKYLLPVFLVVLLPLYALSETTFNVKVPAIVAMGEPFRVEFSANGRMENFQAPDFAGFDVIAGPSKSSGTDIRYINGKLSKTTKVTFTYVLVAQKEGNTQIGSATAIIDGSGCVTRVTAIEVMSTNGDESSNNASSSNSSRSSGSSGSQSQSGNDRRQSNPIPKTNKVKNGDILLRTEVSHSSVYKGEAIRVTLKLYTRAQVSSITSFKPAGFNGFWNQEVPMVQPEFRRETYKGTIYDAAVIKEFLLFPQKSGKLKIDPMEMGVNVVELRENAGGGHSLFDSFFSGTASYVNIEKNLKSAAVSINVKELPAGAPASFNGAVGEFTMNAKFSEDIIAANASGMVNLVIAGNGNLPIISAPTLKLPGAFELYATKTKDNFKVVAGNVSGSKIFDYPFIARSEGDFSLEPVKFTFFSASKKKYITLKSEPLNIAVSKDVSSGDAGTTIISGINKEQLQVIGKDIRFIKIGASDLFAKGDFFMGSLTYLITIFVTILLFIATLFYLNKRIKELRDTVKVKNKKANKIALARLKLAKRHMVDKRESEFYREMLRALSGYISDKLNIQVAKLSKEHIKEQLQLKNIESGDIEQLLSTFSNCEFAQYAPSSSVKMDDVYNQTLGLISRFESKL